MSEHPDTPAMTRNDVLTLLREELHDVNDEIPLDLAAGELLRDELGIDSLDLVEFVACVEYRFGFIVPDDDWKGLRTLDAIADYVLAHTAS